MNTPKIYSFADIRQEYEMAYYIQDDQQGFAEFIEGNFTAQYDDTLTKFLGYTRKDKSKVL